MAEEETPAPGAGLESRVGALESGQQSILEKLDSVLGFLSPADGKPAEPERPEVNIAEEIRRQLEERDSRKPPEPASPASPADVKEQAPVPMARRVEKIMGWAQ